MLGWLFADMVLSLWLVWPGCYPFFIITVKCVVVLGCSYDVLCLSGGVVVFEVHEKNPPCPGLSRGKNRPGVGSGSRGPPYGVS